MDELCIAQGKGVLVPCMAPRTPRVSLPLPPHPQNYALSPLPDRCPQLLKQVAWAEVLPRSENAMGPRHRSPAAQFPVPLLSRDVRGGGGSHGITVPCLQHQNCLHAACLKAQLRLVSVRQLCQKWPNKMAETQLRLEYVGSKYSALTEVTESFMAYYQKVLHP